MTVDNAAGLALFVEHRQGVQVGLAAEGFQHGGGRGGAGHRWLVVEQRAEVADFFVQYRGDAVWFGHQGSGVAGRMLLGPAEQITLEQIDAHFGQHGEFFRQFDAFGDHCCPRSFGDLQNRADELTLERVLVNTVDKVPIDLDEIRAQFRPEPQA